MARWVVSRRLLADRLHSENKVASKKVQVQVPLSAPVAKVLPSKKSRARSPSPVEAERPSKKHRHRHHRRHKEKKKSSMVADREQLSLQAIEDALGAERAAEVKRVAGIMLSGQEYPILTQPLTSVTLNNGHFTPADKAASHSFNDFAFISQQYCNMPQVMRITPAFRMENWYKLTHLHAAIIALLWPDLVGWSSLAEPLKSDHPAAKLMEQKAAHGDWVVRHWLELHPMFVNGDLTQAAVVMGNVLYRAFLRVNAYRHSQVSNNERSLKAIRDVPVFVPHRSGFNYAPTIAAGKQGVSVSPLMCLTGALVGVAHFAPLQLKKWKKSTVQDMPVNHSGAILACHRLNEYNKAADECFLTGAVVMPTGATELTATLARELKIETPLLATHASGAMDVKGDLDAVVFTPLTPWPRLSQLPAAVPRPTNVKAAVQFITAQLEQVRALIEAQVAGKEAAMDQVKTVAVNGLAQVVTDLQALEEPEEVSRSPSPDMLSHNIDLLALIPPSQPVVLCTPTFL